MRGSPALVGHNGQLFRLLELLFKLFHSVQRLLRLLLEPSHSFKNFCLKIMFAHNSPLSLSNQYKVVQYTLPELVAIAV